MSQGFPWDNLIASGVGALVGALVGASLGAYLNWRFNRNLEASRQRDALALFRKRAELDAYQPVQVALAGLHESLVGLSELSRLCDALVRKDKESADTLVDLLGSPRESQATEAILALTKDRSELELPKASALLGVKLSSARSMLTQFMHEYGRHRILFQGLA
jgi:hypothetical protein